MWRDGVGKARIALVRPSVPPNCGQTNLTEGPVRSVVRIARPDASLGGIFAGRQSSGIATDWATKRSGEIGTH